MWVSVETANKISIPLLYTMSILNILMEGSITQHQRRRAEQSYYDLDDHHYHLDFLEDQRHSDNCLVAELPSEAILLAEQSF